MNTEWRSEHITMRARPGEMEKLNSLAAEYRTTRASIIRLALKTAFPIEFNGVGKRSRSGNLATETGAAINN